MKYIIIKSGELESGVLFADMIDHANIANGVKSAGYEIRSAGFCEIYPDTNEELVVSTWGKRLLWVCLPDKKMLLLFGTPFNLMRNRS